MKKNILLLILFQSFIALGQITDPEVKVELPTIVPPSPTVAALMKFEETPVNNYTGVPDISIPLFSTGSQSKDIGLNIALKYHCGGVAVDEKASNVGLGWSLFAGGTVSRTVRGMPDEVLKNPYTFEPKIGIYQNSPLLTDFPNRYDEFLYVNDSIPSLSYTYAQIEMRKEYLFESNEKGKYDNEHDLWQFNFMGHTGRFFIKKNVATGVLEVKPLDNYNLKIINHYGISGNGYMPTSFTIYDDKGYKYLFDVIETTTTNSSVVRSLETLDILHNMTEGFTYPSSFHLRQIRDNNDNPIIDFQYSSLLAKEIAIDKSETNANPVGFSISNILAMADNDGNCYPTINRNMESSYSHSTSQRDTTVKTLSIIEVKGVARIFFDYQVGRYDDNLHNPTANSYTFKGIVVKNWNDSIVKSVQLSHFYSTRINKRLMLEGVKIKNAAETKEEAYNLEYVDNINNYGYGTITKDLWGYLKIPNHFMDNSRDTNPYYCTTDLLQKMTLPTGGSVIYDFEANTYSHIGADALPDFDENPYNWDHVSNYAAFDTVNIGNSKILFTIYNKQDVYITSDILTTESGLFRDYSFEFYKVESGGDVPMPDMRLTCYNCGNYNESIWLKDVEPGTYKVKFKSIDPDLKDVLISGTIMAYYKVKNSNDYQFAYGGGNRIKRIGYFTEDVEKNVYQNALSYTPAKEKHYDYNFLEFPLKSSGSLVAPKPLHQYRIVRRPCLECDGMVDNDTYNFDVFTSYNNLTAIKTAGADIGYQNVTVFENGNGKTEFVYNSPIDYPYDTSVPGYPFIMDNDTQDHYRGQVTLERIKDDSGRKLKEIFYIYQYETYTQRIGLKTKYIGELNSCPTSAKYNTYNAYKNYVRRCAQNSGHPEYVAVGAGGATNGGQFVYACIEYGTWETLYDCPCFCYCGEPDEFIGYIYQYETYGWAKLKTKTTQDSFYDSGVPQGTVEKTETFDYNPLNKQLSEHKITNSLGETLKTTYFYHTGNSIHSDNRISEIERIETYKDSTLLSTNKIVYGNSWDDNDSYLPRYIQTAKANETLENRVRFNAYDAYGHPLEVQKEDGTIISYLWGYNHSQPIAKIENATNAQLKTALGITDLSDVDEDDLEDIDLLRSDSQFSTAMITTYTYIPLFGVETITDPRGYTTTYGYDSFGRLDVVKDHNGNKISENEYHHRTQN